MPDNDNPLTIPINVPWRLVSASQDMMDIFPWHDEHGREVGPAVWRSSLAIYAYEPRPDNLDPALCRQRVTFIKVSCSITGYQPSPDDQAAIVHYTSQRDTQIGTDLGDYFACEGALLRVSVFPGPLWQTHSASPPPPLATWPHIIDFEPKKRDLYQTATESGEVLTASKSTVKTDKSLTSVQNSETGVEVGTKGDIGNAGLTQDWGAKTEDKRTTTADASTERREKEGTTTELTQMYNLLTGYHSGTNRAVFLMLPRPHALPPTVHRTFVQGTRGIEGVQDFFLVVSRPEDMEHLCVQAQLETGHIIDVLSDGEAEEAEYERKVQETEPITATVDGLHPVARVLSRLGQVVGEKPKRDEVSFDKRFWGVGEDGWEFDTSRGDSGHGAVEQVILDQDSARPWDLENYNYYIAPPNTLVVEGTLFTTKEQGADAHVSFARSYRVHLRRQKPDGLRQEEERQSLLITQRSLTGCMHHEGDCLVAVPPNGPSGSQTQPGVAKSGMSVIDEVPWRRTHTGNPAAHYASMRAVMTSSAGAAARRPAGATSFVDTDAFARRLRRSLGKAGRARPLSGVVGLSEDVLSKLGIGCTVGDFLNLDLANLALRLECSLGEAARVRRQVIGLRPPESAP